VEVRNPALLAFNQLDIIEVCVADERVAFEVHELARSL
jgi:hypothetical protein